jgi:hypothetical protein
MRTIRRSAVLVAVLALALAFAVPSLASAASTAAVPTRHLPATGGTIKWPVMVHNAKTCNWSSSPKVAGFDGTVKCKTGRVVRPATFKANTSTGAKDYTLNLVVRGTTRTVDHLEVVEAGKPTPTTTTTTTTTTVPPTTTSTTTSTTTTSTSTTTTTLPPASFTGWPTSNWSGYVIEGSVTAVSSEWTVPTLDCAATPDGVTADWVGVNGWNGASGLFQDGTMSHCLNGQQSNFAWWADDPEGYGAVEVFAVAPGDLIYAEVWQDASSGDWAYEVKDLTSEATVSAFPPAADSYSGAGLTAEWIAEDPGCADNPSEWGECWTNTISLQHLADFGTVTFTDLGLTVPSGSWTEPPYSDAIEMVAPDGSVEAFPSPIQGSGTSASFTVTYETPGKMSSSTGTAAMKHPQSTFVAPVPRITPQHRAGQLGSRSIPTPKLGLARIR